MPSIQKEPLESFDPHQSVHSINLTWLLKAMQLFIGEDPFPFGFRLIKLQEG